MSEMSTFTTCCVSKRVAPASAPWYSSLTTVAWADALRRLSDAYPEWRRERPYDATATTELHAGPRRERGRCELRAAVPS